VPIVDHKVWMYLAYLLISVGLTVWVATTLSRNGLVFLEDVFADGKLARAVNQLLVMGFYLLNLGYVAVAMRSAAAVPSASKALETLSMKIGLVLLVLGVLHFFNVFFLNRYRRGRLRQQQGQPPLPPAGRLPMHPPTGNPPPPGGNWPSHPAVPGTPGPQGRGFSGPPRGPGAGPRPGASPPPAPA
jgi:hypothetical protein